MSAQPSPEPSLPPDEDPARYLSVPIGDQAPGEPRAHVIERVRGRWCERSAGGHVGAVGGGERPAPRSGATSSALRSNPMFVVHCESPCETRFFVTRQDGGSAADASLELFGLPRVRWNAARRMRGRRCSPPPRCVEKREGGGMAGYHQGERQERVRGGEAREGPGDDHPSARHREGLPGPGDGEVHDQAAVHHRR